MSNRQTALEFIKQGRVAANDRSQPIHLQHAYQLMSSAVFVDSTCGEAWYELGNANSDLGQEAANQGQHAISNAMYAAAVASWRRGAQGDITPEMKAKLLSNMAWRLQDIGQCKESEACSEEAINLNPRLGGAWLNRGRIHGIYGETYAAVECMRKAVELEDNPTSRMGLAFALLFNGNYSEGFREFEIRFKYRLHQFLKYPYPKWEGESDKTLFLVADQGMGDTLSFARFIPLAAKRSKFVHMVVQHELVRAFEQAFAHIPNKNVIPMASAFVPADAWTTSVSLPYALGLSNDEVVNTPQIEIPRYTTDTGWKVPGKLFHIGISYAGSPLNEINQHRSIPVQQFLDLYRVPGVQLYSLQIGQRAKDLQDTGTIGLIRDLESWIHDVVDTVSILQHLDLVITCESALGHICAAANKECWIPYSWLGRDYRIGQRGERLMWTPAHRIFRQGPDRQWGPVFENIVNVLQRRVHGQPAQRGTVYDESRVA